MSLMSEVGQKAFNLGVPIAVHLDLTYRCNERCVHCYLDHNDHGAVTAKPEGHQARLCRLERGCPGGSTSS